MMVLRETDCNAMHQIRSYKPILTTPVVDLCSQQMHQTQFLYISLIIQTAPIASPETIRTQNSKNALSCKGFVRKSVIILSVGNHTTFKLPFAIWSATLLDDIHHSQASMHSCCPDITCYQQPIPLRFHEKTHLEYLWYQIINSNKVSNASLQGWGIDRYPHFQGVHQSTQIVKFSGRIWQAFRAACDVGALSFGEWQLVLPMLVIV